MKQPSRPPRWNISDCIPEKLQDEKVKSWVTEANREMWNWDEVKYRSPQVGLSHDQAWALIKFDRLNGRSVLPLKPYPKGRPFSFALSDEAHRILHRVDLSLGGIVGSRFQTLGQEDDRKRYLLTSLQDEALASSLIEGAVATREQAQDIIRSNRTPRTDSERMIVNNYHTIRFLNGQKDQPLTVDLLNEIQKRMTDGTLPNPEAGGRLRRSDETIRIMDEESNEVLHVPPPADELPARIRTFCQFANDISTPTRSEQPFIHPVMRAIILHFWLAYDHPYVDGNGRTARAIFYWSMLRSGYWLAEYLSISTEIAKRRKQYAMAYLNSETDENDLSYFIAFHLKCLELSIDSFEDYVTRKQTEQAEWTRILGLRFNSRQQALLAKAFKNPTAKFSYESHMNSHGISLATARTDLLELEKEGYLSGNRHGRRFEFVPGPKTREKK